MLVHSEVLIAGFVCLTVVTVVIFGGYLRLQARRKQDGSSEVDLTVDKRQHLNTAQVRRPSSGIKRVPEHNLPDQVSTPDLDVQG